MKKISVVLLALTAFVVAQEPKGDPKADAQAKRQAAKEAADKMREGLVGQPLPAIKPLKVLNADGFDFAKTKGKVLVIDFWATWCPPCREVVPGLVEMQKVNQDKIQVVGLTAFYERGMDFSDSAAAKPHGGKRVPEEKGAKLSQEEEIKVNEAFAKAFELNYPIVFGERKLGSETFGVMGIPTVFVVGTDGKVLGSVVGGGEEAHKKLMDLVQQALGAKQS